MGMLLRAIMNLGLPALLLQLSGFINVSLQRNQPFCRAAVFNLTTRIVPSALESCPDACTAAFKDFKDALDFTDSRIGKPIQAGVSPAGLPVGDVADQCIHYRRICYNGRLATKGRVNIDVLADYAGPEQKARQAIFRQTSAGARSQTGPKTTPGCVCTQSLAMFSLYRHDVAKRLRLDCEPQQICIRLGGFVTQRVHEDNRKYGFSNQKHVFREWECIADQVDVFLDSIPCKIPSYTPWCSECNSNKRLHAKGVESLRCPVLIPYNRTVLQEYEQQRSELQKKYSAAYSQETGPRARWYLSNPISLSEPQSASKRNPAELNEQVIGASNWPSGQDYSTPDQGTSGLPHARFDANTASTSNPGRRASKRPKDAPFSETYHPSTQVKSPHFLPIGYFIDRHSSMPSNLESMMQPFSAFSFAAMSSQSQPQLQRSIQLAETVSGPEITVQAAAPAGKRTDRGNFVLISSDKDTDCQCKSSEATETDDERKESEEIASLRGSIP